MVALGPSVLQARFVDVVAVIAQPLPIRSIPKQRAVPAMRLFVIDQGCQDSATIAEVDAPRMQRKERF